MRKTMIGIAAGAFVAAAVAFTIVADATDNLAPGKVELKSAGPLAFGPSGILFVGDSVAGSVVALDTATGHQRPPERRSMCRASMRRSPRW